MPEPAAATPSGEVPAALRKHPAQAALEVIAKLDQSFQAAAQIITDTVVSELRNAVGAIINEVRNSQPMCSLCGLARADWDDRNEAAVAEAQLHHAQAAASLQPGEQLPDVLMFLPADIRPDPEDPLGQDGHLPAVFQATTYIAGNGYCAWHLAQEAAARRALKVPGSVDDVIAKTKPPILVASGMSVASAVAAASRPGVPGSPVR